MRTLAAIALILALGRVAPVAMRHALPVDWSFKMDAACQWYPRAWLKASGIFYLPPAAARAAQVRCYLSQGVTPFPGRRTAA